MPVQIRSYTSADREDILSIWEKSVKATHHFLLQTDFLEIREMLHNLDFSALNLWILTVQNEAAGFIGLHESKIEMLFLHPEYTGKGLGTLLVNHAKTSFGANAVDVNEQNEKAKYFYEKLGFHTFERCEKDDQGKDYPILKMQLLNSSL